MTIPLINNIIMSSLKKAHYADGSGILSTFSIMGSSMGTVFIGLTFFLAVYFSLAATLPVNYPQYQDQKALDKDIYTWVGKVIHPNMEVLSQDHNLDFMTGESSASGMKTAFTLSAVLLFVGLLSLFMKPPPIHEH